MLLVGLTGNIASGKSAVANLLRHRGALVIDADVLAREAVAPGSTALRGIVDRWGESVLESDGHLNRPALRRIIFADPAEREALNAIVHPEVERLRGLAVEQARERGVSIVVCDVPLLFETNLETRFDLVILVEAREPTRLDRLLRERGLSAEEARAMMATQLPVADTRERADLIVENDGTRAALEQRVDEVWAALVDRAQSR